MMMKLYDESFSRSIIMNQEYACNDQRKHTSIKRYDDVCILTSITRMNSILKRLEYTQRLFVQSHFQKSLTHHVTSQSIGRFLDTSSSSSHQILVASRSTRDLGTSTMESATTWRSDCTQEEFMKKDECILVDYGDRIVGHSSKYDAHRFESPKQPTGLLHRAFSVFLFDDDSRLLLQQRAASKITFPNVWTNTCCSHPLHGYDPTEVDDLSKSGNMAPGAARAAIRKLEHELGIDRRSFEEGDFKFLTRLHYCARDYMNPEWGEHEMDYILFCRKDVKGLLKPHPDEVQATRFVTREELKDMMRPDSGLLWSPWFRIIADTFLDRWWDDLEATLSTDACVDKDTIHKII